MRALKYRLENGTVVNSMSQAKASGQKYEIFLEEIRETNRKNISPVRKAMLEQFGYVHPSLKDKVVLDQRRRPLKQGRFFMPKLNAALAPGPARFIIPSLPCTCQEQKCTNLQKIYYPILCILPIDR